MGAPGRQTAPYASIPGAPAEPRDHGGSTQQAPDHLPPAAPRPHAGPLRPPAAPPAPVRAPLRSGTSEAPAVRVRTDLGWRIADAYLVIAALALSELLG
ncbi:MAG: hypothetical protein IT372_08725, partial [Polyangiaceae bacterium]|nr:hypothetical protein [Polyangiaceae bacterium]